MAAPKGSRIIQAADKAGIPIPRFCYHDKLSIAANCRMCLVEVEKAPKLQIACNTQVTDGMVVHTNSDKAKAAQKAVLEFLLTTCPHCQHTADILSKMAKEFGPKIQIYGIAMNEDPDLPGFIKQFNVAFPVGTGPREPVYDFLQHSVMNPRINFPQVLFIVHQDQKREE